MTFIKKSETQFSYRVQSQQQNLKNGEKHCVLMIKTNRKNLINKNAIFTFQLTDACDVRVDGISIFLFRFSYHINSEMGFCSSPFLCCCSHLDKHFKCMEFLFKLDFSTISFSLSHVPHPPTKTKEMLLLMLFVILKAPFYFPFVLHHSRLCFSL